MGKVYNVNVPMTYDGSTYMYYLKETLKSAGWVVSASSDGSTFYSASDGITTDAVGAGGMNNNLAWYWIVDPDNKKGFTFQRGTHDTYWRVYGSHFWHTSSFSTGSVTATPEHTDTSVTSPSAVFLPFGSGSAASPNFSLFFDISSSYAGRAHIIAYDTPYNNTYPFYAFASTNNTTTGRTNSLIVLEPLLTGSHPVDEQITSFFQTRFVGGTSYETYALNTLFSSNVSILISYNGYTFGVTQKFVGSTKFVSDYGTGLQNVVSCSMPSYLNTLNQGNSFFTPQTWKDSQHYKGSYPMMIYPIFGTLSSDAKTYGKYIGLPAKIRINGYGNYGGQAYGLKFPDTINLTTDAYIVVAGGYCVPWPENVTPIV